MGRIEVFSVVDATYFVGGVGLANTVAHHLPSATITFLDGGLRPDQRRWLEARHAVVDPPTARHLHAAKPFPALHLDRLDPDDVVVVADADVVATGSWDSLVARARSGVLVAANDPSDRHFEEWCTLLGLSGPLQVRPYINSGLTFWSVRHHAALLRRWWDLCALLGEAGGAHTLGPSCVFGDQDVVNALLMTEFTDTPVDVRSYAELAMGHTLPGVRVLDLHGLTCTGPTGPVLALHVLMRPKPWEPAAAWRLRSPTFARILRSAIATDVRTSPPDGPLEPSAIVPWLRPGVVGAACLAVATAVARLRRTWRTWRSEHR